jgi:hypothetical protein
MRAAPAIAHNIVRLPGIVAPTPRQTVRAVEVSAERSGRAINTKRVINGMRVQVQRRRAVAIHIG